MVQLCHCCCACSRRCFCWHHSSVPLPSTQLSLCTHMVPMRECSRDAACFDNRKLYTYAYKCSNCGAMSIVTRDLLLCAPCFWECDPAAKGRTQCSGEACTLFRTRAPRKQLETTSVPVVRSVANAALAAGAAATTLRAAQEQQHTQIAALEEKVERLQDMVQRLGHRSSILEAVVVN